MGKKGKKSDKPTSVRLYPAEEDRLEFIYQKVLERNPVITKTFILRELLGLEEVRLLTEEEREYFHTGEGLEAPRPQVPEPVRQRA